MPVEEMATKQVGGIGCDQGKPDCDAGGNECEFQELNFYGGSSSICTNVDSSVVYALFMGLLNSTKN
jgi:hypothetical protein